MVGTVAKKTVDTSSSTANCCSIAASQVPLDVLATVFSRLDISVRDRGSARLVCRHWRSAIDGLTVRRLELRSLGPGHCTLQLLRRFPLLQSISLGVLITSNRTAFSWALGQLSALVHLTRLSLEFSSASAVRLPSSLQALSRLQALSLAVSAVQPGQLQSHAAAAAAAVSAASIAAAVDDTDADGGASAGGQLSLHSLGVGSRATLAQEAVAAAVAAVGGAVGAGAYTASSGTAGAAPAAQHVPPAGLLPLLSSLSSLTSLELSNLAISVPDVLAAVRRASNAAAATDSDGGSGGDGGGVGCLRRLFLVGSGVNLTGVGDPVAALAQLALLETLYVDGCTGADTLVPLLRHLRGVRHLTLAGMDYAWAAAAGYHHRRAGFDSSNDLQVFEANGPNHRFNGLNYLGMGGPAGQQHPFDMLGGGHGVGGVGGGGGLDGFDGSAAAAMAAVASGRPLAFLMCLPQLASLSLAGSFLRTLPNRDIGGLSALTALDLSGNGIDDLPQGLASLPLLSRLDVSHNELVSLPAWLGQMQSLESLSAHHNCLERFPALLYDLTRLSYLAMGHNRINWWPVECAIPRQRRLAAAATAAGIPLPPFSNSNSTTTSGGSSTSPPSASISSAAATATTTTQPLSLVSLDLSYNRLFGLPGGLPLLCALRALRLRQSLAALDGAGTARAMSLLAGLTGLKELDLSSNHLDQHAIVPLSELRELRQLWLADNGLEELPLGLAHLSHLTLLSLRANRFTEVPVCLRWLSSLEVLDLSCNRLSELPHWIGGINGHPNRHFNDHVNGHIHNSFLNRHGSSSSGSDCSSSCTDNEVNHSNSSICRAPSADYHYPSLGQPQRHHLKSGHIFTESQRKQPNQQQERKDNQALHHLGLIGLRHLDVSQQYSVIVRESAVPHIPPRLEVQPPHCLYGPLQGDLPMEILRLPHLRSLVLQRHPFLGLKGSRVLRILQARGVEVFHPRPLRVEALPGAAAAAFTTAAAAGGLLFPGGVHSALLRTHDSAANAAAAHLVAAAAAAAAAAASAASATNSGQNRDTSGLSSAVAAMTATPPSLTFFNARETVLLMAMISAVPLVAAAVCLGFGLPPPPYVVVLVLVVAVSRLAVYSICLGRDLERRRMRQREAVTAAAVAIGAAAAGGATVNFPR